MSILKEGRLEFDFSRAKSAVQLDAPGVPIPVGMCLVDFVVEETHKLLLIEVKDPEGAPAAHRQNAVESFLKKLNGKGLINGELVPKARDSYTFLHLMNRDTRDFIFVVVLGVPDLDLALLGAFKNRLLARIRKEAAAPWVRAYVKDVIVVTPSLWNAHFAAYPLTSA